ncbi:MAG: DUF2147 domain-containing protein [Pseudomonadota bacterium]
MFLALIAAPALAESPEGVWATQPDKTGAGIHVEIKPCVDQSRLCGTIVALFGPASDDPDTLVGREMIRQLAADGDTAWSGGTIWATDEDKSYDAEMELKGPDTLSVSGCILGGLICRGQDWSRVP